MTQSLQNKVAIITGAGQGIGAGIAQALARAGAKVVINDINPDRAERVAQAIVQDGATAVAIPADISNKFQCSHLIDTTRQQFGGLDILINNAAIKPTSSLFKTDEYEWQRVLDVNLKGAFFMTQLGGRVMAGILGRGEQPVEGEVADGGIIVNIASTAGVSESFANHAAYAASKAGLVGLAREAAREFAAHDIWVYALTLPEPTEATAVAPTIITLCTDPPQDKVIIQLDE